MEHLPILDKQHPFCMAGRLDAVGYHQDGLPLPVDSSEQIEKLVGCPGIQRARRLIRQNDRRIHHQGPGNRRPLLLASRDLIRKFLHKLLNPQLSHDGVRLLFHFPVALLCQNHGQIDIVLQRKRIQQIKILKHEA